MNVHDRSSGELVAAEITYPPGLIDDWLQPGDGARFEHLALIPSYVRRIDWVVTIEDHPGSVDGAGASE